VNFVYGFALIVGFVALVGWVIGRFLPDGLNESIVARRIVGGLIAFGMGGLSASYAGWHPIVALGAGIVAAGLVAWYVGKV